MKPNTNSNKIKHARNHHSLMELIETMESAKYTVKEAMQAIQELDFGEDTWSINRYIENKMQNNDFLK